MSKLNLGSLEEPVYSVPAEFYRKIWSKPEGARGTPFAIKLVNGAILKCEAKGMWGTVPIFFEEAPKYGINPEFVTGIPINNVQSICRLGGLIDGFKDTGKTIRECEGNGWYSTMKILHYKTEEAEIYLATN